MKPSLNLQILGAAVALVLGVTTLSAQLESVRCCIVVRYLPLT